SGLELPAGGSGLRRPRGPSDRSRTRRRRRSGRHRPHLRRPAVAAPDEPVPSEGPAPDGLVAVRAAGSDLGPPRRGTTGRRSAPPARAPRRGSGARRAARVPHRGSRDGESRAHRRTHGPARSGPRTQPRRPYPHRHPGPQRRRHRRHHCHRPAPGGHRMLTAATIDSALHLALDEDAPWGDVTGEVFIPVGASARAQLRAREDGVLAGIEVFARTFALVDAATTVELRAADGDASTSGDVLATVHGSARAVLRAERIALNFCQRTSGIATETRAYVDAAAGRARIADTRKTIPGLRAFDKHAV